MRDEFRIKAVQDTLAKYGVVVSPDTATAVYEAAIAEPPGAIFAVGDFVSIHQGMGETAFGRLVDLKEDDSFLIDYSWGDEVSYQGRSKPSGDWYRSTPEEAREYYLVRTGQKK